MSNKIIILTGEIQTGKTSFLQQFCDQRNNAAGILTPIVNGRRMFYNISEKDLFEMEAMSDEEKLVIGKYLFSADAFVKANTILLNASKDVEYLIIDEIGPLEIRQQKGLYDSLVKILQLPFTYTLVIVVRKSLADEAIKIFNMVNADVMSIGEIKEYFKETP